MVENQADPSAPPEPAPGAELSIPKHRFDQVNDRVRQLTEEMSMKDRLYLEDRQRMQQQQQPQREVTLTPEDTGLDPQTHQAVMKMASQIAKQEINAQAQVFGQQIGILAARTEKAELLATKGADKSKYLPDILKFQQQHFANTGGFMPAETALEILQSREKDQRIAALEARLAGNPPPADAPVAQIQQTPPAAGGGVPSAAGTRQIPSGGAAGPGSAAKKTFAELSVEEMEARLQEQFTGGQTL